MIYGISDGHMTSVQSAKRSAEPGYRMADLGPNKLRLLFSAVSDDDRVLIMTGDVFNRYSETPAAVNAFLRVVNEFNVRVFYGLGQHDYKDRQDSDDSSVATLREHPNFTQMGWRGEEPMKESDSLPHSRIEVQGKRVVICGVSYMEYYQVCANLIHPNNVYAKNRIDQLKALKRNADSLVMSFHGHICPRPPQWLANSIPSEKLFGALMGVADLILVGDIHQQFIHGDHNDGSTLVNTGPLVRLNIDTQDMRPQVVIWNPKDSLITPVILSIHGHDEVSNHYPWVDEVSDASPSMASVENYRDAIAIIRRAAAEAFDGSFDDKLRLLIQKANLNHHVQKVIEETLLLARNT